MVFYMKITPDILAALKAAVDRAGSQSALAHEAGLHPTMIGKYLLGKATWITDDVWQRLQPLLAPHLPGQGERTPEKPPEKPQEKQQGLQPVLSREAWGVEDIMRHGTEEEKHQLQEALTQIYLNRAVKRSAQ